VCENSERLRGHDEDDKGHVEEGNEFIMEVALKNIKKGLRKERKGALKCLTLRISHNEFIAAEVEHENVEVGK